MSNKDNANSIESLRETCKFPVVSPHSPEQLFGDLSRHYGNFSEISFDHATISQKGNFGDFDYEELVPGIQFVAHLLNELVIRDLSCLPPSQIQNLSNAFAAACSWITTIKNTRAKDAQVDYIRKHKTEISKDIEKRTNELLPLLAYTGSLDVSINPIHRAIGECEYRANKAGKLLDELGIRVKTFQRESIEVLDACQVRLDETVVSKQSQKFSSLAQEYKHAADRWLKAICGITFLIVAVAFLFYFLASIRKDPLDFGIAIQLVAAKLVVISVLTFLLVAFVRNYRAHRHNQVLSEHRATTLNTYEQFLKAARDDATKDRLLTLIAEAAFTPKQTGYDHADRDSGHPMQQVLDLHGALNKPSP